MAEIRNAVELYRSGLITMTEAREMLDKLNVRGAFGGGGNFFIGYDYKNQCWVEIP